MPGGLKVFHKGLILVGTPLVVELLLITALFVVLVESDRKKEREAVYHRGAAVSARLVALTAELPLLFATSVEYKSDLLSKRYQNNLIQIENYTKEINKIRDSSPEISTDFKEELQQGQSKVIALTKKFEEKTRNESSTKVLDSMFRFSKELHDLARSKSTRLHELIANGDTTTEQTRQEQEQLRQLQNWILLIGIACNVGSGIALTIFFRRSILSPIAAITNNTIALAKGEKMAPALAGGDEIAKVDQSFHAMQDQLQAAKERELALFQNASDVICVLNENLEFEKINPVCLQHWGFESAELQGRSVDQIIATGELRLFKEKINASKTADQTFILETLVDCKNGEQKDMLWSAYWSESEKKLYCTVHDLSDQKQLDRAKSQFLELLSSNLRRPLSSIADKLNILLNSDLSTLSEQAQTKLGQCNASVARLVNLVQELLKMNELKEGKIELNRDDCNLAAIVEQAIKEVEVIAEGKQIKLIRPDFQGSSGRSPRANVGDLHCYGDQKRLVQVLVNLLSNAIKFSPEESEVAIKLSCDEELINCSIVDKGRGISAAQIANIFKRFEQAETADAKRQSGTGLGLPICKDIIEEHGGEITVESEQSKGSTFTFSVPRTISSSKSRPKAALERDLNYSLFDIAAKPDLTQISMPAGQKLFAFKLASKGLILEIIPLVCEILIVTGLSLVIHQVDQERKFELHERKVANCAETIMISYIDAQARLGGEPNPEEWLKIETDMQDARIANAQLLKLVAREPQVRSFVQKAQHSFEKFKEPVAVASKAMAENRSVFISFPERHDSIPTLLNIFFQMNKVVELAESKESSSPTKQAALRKLQGTVLLLGLAVNIGSSLLLAVFFSKDINSRLMLLADNANRLAEEKALNNAMPASDEIANLDRIFHETASELLDARQKERAIFDNSQDVIGVIDENGRFQNINNACGKIFSYSKEKMLKQKTLFDITYANDIEKTKKALEEWPNKQNRFTFENRIVRRTGEIADMLWSCTRNAGEPTLYFIAHDISARRKLDSFKQEFLAMISHDLRTPLTAILGTTQLALKGTYGPLGESESSLLQQIYGDCKSLVDLISDLLDFDKMSAGKMPFELEEAELADLIKDAISLAGGKDKIKLEYTLELDETVVMADSDRLTQALTNLMKCAIETSPGLLRVRLDNIENLAQLKLIPESSASNRETFADLFKQESNNIYALAASTNVSKRLSVSVAQSILKTHKAELAVKEDPENKGMLNLQIDFPL